MLVQRCSLCGQDWWDTHVCPKLVSLPPAVVLPKQPVEDLKAFAGKVCIDIFNDFDDTEISSQPTSIRRAWDIGKALADA